jgi:hypothetical protein
MVERVRINGSQIILKNANNAAVFNTANFYLKTDPNGQLKAGGYAEVPSVWGYEIQNISNKTTGGYTSGIVSGVINRNVFMTTYSTKVPKYTTGKIVLEPRYILPTAANTYFSDNKTAYFNGEYTGTTYRWAGGIVPVGESYIYGAWISDFIPPARTQSGTWEFYFYPSDLVNWIRYQPDGYGNIYVRNYRDDTQSTDPYGYVSIQTISLVPFCIMTTSTPVTLSVATTL